MKVDSLMQGQWATPERMRQEGGISIDGVGLTAKDQVIQLRAKAKYPTKLHRYCYQYDKLTESQMDAGLKYSSYYEQAGWMPVYPVTFTRLAPGGTGMDWSAVKIAAQAKIKAADILLEAQERHMVKRVAGYDEWTGGRNWRENQQLFQYLSTGLTKLIPYFGTDRGV